MNWIKLRTGDGGVLLCSAGEEPFVKVALRPCFPLSHPGQYFALIAEGGREVALVESPMNLDLESRKALELVRATAEFVIDVKAVRSIESAGDIFVWDLSTEQGNRIIQTGAGEWPRRLADGAALVEDVYGDLYQIPSPRFLDSRSRKVLDPMIG